MLKKGIAIKLGLAMLPVIFVLLFIFAIAGASMMSSENEVEVSAGGCSPIGGLNQEKWSEGIEKAGVFKGKQNTFMMVSRKYGIDPVLFAAIAMNETAWGTSKAVAIKNNPGGLMDAATGMATVKVFASLDEGLDAMGQTLHNRIIVDGLNTIEKLGNVYAPVGAANDPSNLNSNWIPTVYSIAEKLGGLTMNCAAEVGSDIKIVGDKMNYFDAVLQEAKKYNGWSYSWGGSNPDVGFDCSGLMQWSFKRAGINLPRTAQEQYAFTQRIPASDVKAGDFIFFKGTYGGANHISHVGIVINEKMMYDSNSSGIGYHDYQGAYWKSHFAGFGRIDSTK
ncbi:hypothetical protein HBP98_17185 [Listeria booriae]|uniref:NlpC/P60 domain-containing protein n=1 Tax=Listeria booriae TaxID=1552123 RepID=A0A7X1A9U9_9LIST|nr:NlpC/P60 family protein [Listeria booriae]MBC2373748.1 hypothetical protein [Listeria booriae]